MFFLKDYLDALWKINLNINSNRLFGWQAKKRKEKRGEESGEKRKSLCVWFREENRREGKLVE